MKRVAVQYAVARKGVPSAVALRRVVGVALGARHRDAALCLRVVGRAEGRRLNREFRDRDYATNVLSFPAPSVGRGGKASARLLGDVVICAPVVAAEARTQHKPLAAHWAHLVVHGTLHLLGHDHLRRAEAERMERLERRLLAGLGHADPYQYRSQPKRTHER